MSIRRLWVKTKRTGGFKKRRRRFGSLLSISTISIVLIAALGVLGVSYASWDQSFNLFGSITTGEINVIVRDVALESSDSNESIYFNVSKTGNVADEVYLDVITDVSPFSSVLVFTVENGGTVPVVCEGLDSDLTDDLGLEIIEAPGTINVGQTAPIKVKLTKGYCKDFEFSTFLRFAQSIG